jgi:hypothetical protein
MKIGGNERGEKERKAEKKDKRIKEIITCCL